MSEAKRPIDDLVHRVNNLLGTIAMQCEVARSVDTHDACRQALRMIEESAQRTQQQVQQFRAGGDRARE